MSFTADIYKEILFDISAGTNQTQPFAMRRTAFNNCFSVEDGFPKITKSNLPQGVSNLTYRISIALCIPYAQSIESVFKVLKGGNCCAKRKNS